MVEGPTGVKLRECADKVIGLKQEISTIKQAQKAQASTQDSLRAAVSVLDKQVQVLPSTLAKQLAQPMEDILPKTKSEAALQRQPTEVQQQVADVSDKQMHHWTGVLDQAHPDDNEPAHVRLARLNQQQQQQQVPLTRQLIVETAPPAVQQPSMPAAQQQAPEPPQPAPVFVQVSTVATNFALSILSAFLSVVLNASCMMVASHTPSTAVYVATLRVVFSAQRVMPLRLCHVSTVHNCHHSASFSLKLLTYSSKHLYWVHSAGVDDFQARQFGNFAICLGGQSVLAGSRSQAAAAVCQGLCSCELVHGCNSQLTHLS